jgi:transketolase
MIVISPCDSIEAKKATLAAAQNKKPTYIRLIREKTPVVTTEDTPFEIGRASIIFEPIVGKPDVAIVATGALVYKALVAAKELEKEKIGVTVVNLSTIKPLDTKTILAVAKSSGAIITVEEHQIAGGMGGAISEFLAANYPVPMEFLGVTDKFGQSGTPDELVEHYEMGVPHIKLAVQKILKRK